MTPSLRVALVSIVFVAPFAFVAGGGCTLLRSPSGPPGPSGPDDELAQLGRLVDAAAPMLLAGRIACQALPPADRADCDGTLDALDFLATEAGGIVRAGEACRQGGDAACLAASMSEARRLLPELQRLLGGAPASSSAAPPSSSSAAPAPASSTSRLRAVVVVARTLAPLGATACAALPASDQATCQGTLAALRTALVQGQGVLAAADRCPAADVACLAAAEAEARRQLPELERLAGQVEALARSQPASSDPYAARDILRQMRPAGGGGASAGGGGGRGGASAAGGTAAGAGGSR